MDIKYIMLAYHQCLLMLVNVLMCLVLLLIMQRLHCELTNAIIRQIPDCGHLPHVEKPNLVAKLIMEHAQEDCYKEIECVS